MTTTKRLARVIAGEVLEAGEMEAAMAEIMAGRADPVAAGGLLTAMATRGEHIAEVVGAARAMRAAARPFGTTLSDSCIDTCGTGGDGAGTFNISTTAAFIVAGVGVPVAKHGNRAVSSKSGSADVLAALGAVIDLDIADMQRVLEEVGFAFLFAPTYHPAMRHAMPIRRSLGVRTIFNLLGPVSNPAQTPYQVVGVFAEKWLSLAEVLAELDTRRAMVVHGQDGLDELSLSGPTTVAELRDGAVSRYVVTPEDVGLARCRVADLVGGDANHNANMLRRTLTPGQDENPVVRAVLFNAGAALYVAGRADDLRSGVELARQSVGSGAALGKVEAFIEASRSYARGRP